MSMNLPPRFDDEALSARMWQGISGLETSDGLDLLLRYQQPGELPATARPVQNGSPTACPVSGQSAFSSARARRVRCLRSPAC